MRSLHDITSTPVAHGVTRSEFVEIFSRYGVVSHSVILATIDNSSRRRGFVVMSTHAEALSALGSFEIKYVFSPAKYQRG